MKRTANLIHSLTFAVMSVFLLNGCDTRTDDPLPVGTISEQAPPTNSPDPVAPSLINGYRLTQRVTHGIQQVLISTETITWNDPDASNEWVVLERSGAVKARWVNNFNEAGRLINTDGFNAGGQQVTSIKYALDNGLITHRVDHGQITVKYDYDSDGILRSRSHYDVFDHLFLQSILQSDSAGNIISSVDTIYKLNGSKLENPVTRNYEYTYNDKNQLISMNYPVVYIETITSIRTDEFFYDENGNVSERITKDADGEFIKRIDYTYEISPIPIVNDRLRANRFNL